MATGTIVKPSANQSYGNLTCTLSGVTTSTSSLVRVGDMAVLRIIFGNGTAFSDASTGDVLTTIPEGWRPANYCNLAIQGRTSGNWANSEYYEFAVQVLASNGDVQIRGNEANLKRCQYLFGTLIWPIGM